jgi:DNA-binding transcriptional regulator YbjK
MASVKRPTIPAVRPAGRRSRGRQAQDYRPRGTARREALLDAALKIIGEVGAEAVTHRRVAEVSGLPLASTTYWFESKEQLLTAALELAAERDIGRLRAYIASASDATAPLDMAITSILGASDETIQTSRGSLLAAYALLLEAARRPALALVARRWTDAYLEILGPLLARAGSRQSRDDAELLLAAVDGLLLEQLASGTASDLGPRVRRLAVALIEAA